MAKPPKKPSTKPIAKTSKNKASGFTNTKHTDPKTGRFVAEPAQKGLSLIEKLKRSSEATNIAAYTKSSIEWWRKTVTSSFTGGDRARDELIKHARREDNFRSTVTIGRMYSFYYDAKHKDTLPYWDIFPLVFILGPAKDGFLSLNLHYCSPKMRAILFHELMKIDATAHYSKATKLKISYSILKTIAKSGLYKNCVKHHLFSQLKSKLILIPHDEWELALFMPTQSFVGASSSQVWSDTALNSKK